MAQREEEGTRKKRGAAGFLVGTLRPVLRFSVTVLITIGFSVAIHNEFFSEGSTGWKLRESETQFGSDITRTLADVRIESKLEVGGDIRITGSELQLLDSESRCEESAPTGEGWICFEEGRFLISEDGGAYEPLAGRQGEQGERGPPGPQGEPGEPGGTARIWVDDGVALLITSTVPTFRNFEVLVSGLTPRTSVEVTLLRPDGSSSMISSGQSDGIGAFFVRRSMQVQQTGMHIVVATDSNGTVLATHPIRVRFPIEP